MWDENKADWEGRARIVILNQVGTSTALPELVESTSLPVLQDTVENAVFQEYAAQKWYLFVVRPDGTTEKLWYKLSMPGENPRLIAEVDRLIAEGT